MVLVELNVKFVEITLFILTFCRLANLQTLTHGCCNTKETQPQQPQILFLTNYFYTLPDKNI